MDKALRIEYQDQLKVGPHVIVLDGRRAVDASYDAPVVLGREVLSMAAWMTIFVARGQQWAIEVVGPSEYREELGQIRDQFLAQFHVLAATQ
jgi:hypothetical protein